MTVRHSWAVNSDWVDSRRRLRATRGGVRHAPHLWPVWIAAPIAIIVACALAWVLYQHVLGSSAVVGAKPLDVVRITLTLMAGFAAVLTGVYAYRKQRLSEGDAARADADQLTQRYSTAAEQLGHGKAAVRLAGVFAMARLADDWPKQRQQCIDVLCAYLRMPTEPDSGASETEVRATVVRTIAGHLRDDSAISWREHDFDFSGATFYDAEFVSVTFSGERTSFRGATFSGELTSFSRATFSSKRTSFTRAGFFGNRTTFSRATFNGESASFDAATFSGGRTKFTRATFSGESASFARATFSGGSTTFEGATFCGGTTADEALSESSFVGPEIHWGPISPRPHHSPASET